MLVSKKKLYSGRKERTEGGHREETPKSTREWGGEVPSFLGWKECYDTGIRKEPE